MRSARKLLLGSASLAGLLVLGGARPADACGCFTPPDPSVPIVQAGENILFAMKDGVVTAHIQVQYSGPAEEFGWLLPLPSIPEVGVGTDELFAQLIATTQPKYRLNREYEGNCPFDPQGPGNFGGSPASDSGGSERGEDSVLVLRDSVGPYDYAVLRADSQQPMLDWLAANRFFVPTATATAVAPYIRPGAYFLALKLRKGNDVGDLQPVVVKYRSDLPMIPIVLTSVAADPDMGVQVWMLGEHRAIPRNYYHTVINDAQIDWLNAGANYVDVVTRAVDEAPGHRSFVTEYAGTSAVMQNVLDYPGRFGDVAHLATITDVQDYMTYLLQNGYAVFSNQPPTFGLLFTSQMLAILSKHLPMPAKLVELGIRPTDYYASIEYWAAYYAQNYPEEAAVAPADLEFDPVVMTREIDERVVQPTLAAGALFRTNPYLTRLFTTLSPDEMTRDPVFSFNPDLGEVSNVHEGRLVFHCGFGTSDITRTPATIVTEQGWTISLPGGTADNPWTVGLDAPASARTEVLREEGAAVVFDDNTDEIAQALDRDDEGGCAIPPVGREAARVSGLAGLAALALALVRRRTRDRAR